MAVLQTLQGVNPGQCFPLEGESAILGRHPDCDIVLESGAVSRQHARIVYLDGEYYIEDLESRNGTFVNGQLVLDRQLLGENDELGVCDLKFAFHLQPRSLDPVSDGQAEAATGIEATALMIDDAQPLASSTVMSKVDVSSGSSGLQLEVNTEAKLRALIEIWQSLGRALGLGQVLPKLLDSLFLIFVQADRGFIVLEDRNTGRLVPKAVKQRRSGDTETIRISRTIINNVMSSKKAILSANAAADSRFDMAESIVDFQIRSMICAPLINSEGNALGVIQIDSLDQRTCFTREDLDVLAGVACHAAIAVENAELHEAAVREQALARELAVAHEVQQRLLPAGSPQVASYDFFEFYDAASELGGDYYDYVNLPDGRLGVVVADVSGKGISASLLTAKLSSETRYCLASEPSPGDAMARLNRAFCGHGWEDRFVTLVMCVLDPATHRVTIVNAGHLPPLLRDNLDQVAALGEDETRLPLGIEEDVEYPELTVELSPGSVVLLYTDGITEAMNHDGDLYGNGRLWQQFAADAGGVSAIGKGVLEDVKRFAGSRPQSDDMCLTCFGRKAEVES